MKRHAKGPRFFQFLSLASDEKHGTRARRSVSTSGTSPFWQRLTDRRKKKELRERARLLGEESDLFLIGSTTRQVGRFRTRVETRQASCAIGRAHRTRDTHRSLTSLLKMRQLDRGQISRYRGERQRRLDEEQRSATTEPVFFLTLDTFLAWREERRCIYQLVIATIITFGDCRYADDRGRHKGGERIVLIILLNLSCVSRAPCVIKLRCHFCEVTTGRRNSFFIVECRLIL